MKREVRYHYYSLCQWTFRFLFLVFVVQSLWLGTSLLKELVVINHVPLMERSVLCQFPSSSSVVVVAKSGDGDGDQKELLTLSNTSSTSSSTSSSNRLSNLSLNMPSNTSFETSSNRVSNSFWSLPAIANRTFFFIHTGKTGGDSVGNTIRMRCLMKGSEFAVQSCHDSFSEDVTRETVLSKQTIGIKHSTWVEQSNLERATTMLWSTRDPMDRVASAFYMATPLNARSKRRKKRLSTPPAKLFFNHCFQHVQDFVRALQEKSNKKTQDAAPSQNTEPLVLYKTTDNNNSNNTQVVTTTCRELAWSALKDEGDPVVDWDNYHNIQRKHRFSGHIAKNYESYHKETLQLYPQKEVMVIRTEYLWHDLQQLEYLLGGNAPVGPEHYRNDLHGSEEYIYKSKLTEPGLLQTLCCAISQDILVYMDLIHRATNLQPHEKQESLTALEQRCQLSRCP